MLDQRLLNKHDHIAELQEKASKLQKIEKLNWFPIAVDEIRKWLFGFIDANKFSSIIDTKDINEIITRLNRDELPGKNLALVNDIPPSLPENINGLLQNQIGSEESEESEESEWVYATAIAEAIANESDNLLKVVTLWRLSYNYSIAWFKLRHHLAKKLRENTGKAHNFVKTCQKILDHTLGNIHFDVREADREDFIKTTEEFEKRRSFFNTIEWELIFGHINCYSFLLDILDVVRLLDKKKYVNFLDTIKSPAIISSIIINGEIDKSLSEQVNLLNLSLENSTEINLEDSILIPLLFKKIHYSLKEIEEYYTKNPDIENKSEEDITEIVNVLISSDVTGALSFYWITYLISRDESAHNSNSDVLKHTYNLIRMLSEGLHSKGFILSSLTCHFYKLIELNQQRKTRIDMAMYGFYALCSIFIKEEKPSIDTSQLLVTIYKSSLLKSHFGLRTSYNGQFLGYADYQVGLLLSHFDNPSVEWLSIWNDLSKLRRDSLYYSYTRKNISTSPDLTHAYSGLAAVEWLISGGFQKHAVALDLWIYLLKISLRNNELHFQDDWKIYIMNLYARLPYIINSIDSGEHKYAYYLEYLGGDNELWIAACDALKLNGVNLNEVNSDLSTTDLNYIFNSYLAWNTRDGGKKRTFNLVDQAKSLLEVLREQ
ncbi:hypothetical protein ABF162_08430 [Vibrio coralliilyticus]|uniref:hypothetical protein n=1 Tax=Vibrio coralliilyticus TaxID=190893 RepID=UPI000512724B|nr:hypothetical protein [Vibrio coralliilyticus]AIU67023.1 hypothetical protein JV59_32415 [Vibrio coralliilyticus]